MGRSTRLRIASANEIAPSQGRGPNRSVRCLGIDYGTRRIGLSYGDELGVATPLPALTEADEARRWAALLEVARGRRVTDLVVGHPLNMDDTAGPKAKEAEAFAARLGAELGLPVHLVDERLTSQEAESTIAKARRRDVRASGIVDSRAATLILQDFLNQRFPPEMPSAPDDEDGR
jgi:putative Holliday junction resolvase